MNVVKLLHRFIIVVSCCGLLLLLLLIPSDNTTSPPPTTTTAEHQPKQQHHEVSAGNHINIVPNDGNKKNETDIVVPEAAEPDDGLRRRPIVFVVSHGTTATHSIYSALCHSLGIPSLHAKDLWCGDDKARSEGWRAHEHFFDTFLEHALCKQETVTQCPTTVDDTWMNQMKRLIDNVLQADDLDALTDTPYPYFAEYVVEAATRIRGVPPIVLLSERDPHEWATSRIVHSMPLCLVLNTTRTTDDDDDLLQPGELYFDITQCHKDAAARKGHAAKLMHKNAFLKRTGWSREQLVQQAAAAYAQYQDAWRERSHVVVNLFAKTLSQKQRQSSSKLLARDFAQAEPRLEQYWPRP